MKVNAFSILTFRVALLLLACLLAASDWSYAQQEPPAPTPQPTPAASPATTTPSPPVWLDPDGNPLPFTSDEEVMEFLRTARVVRIREIPQGITRPRKALLEKDGIRMNAVFRDVDEEKSVMQFASGKTEMGFRDSYLFEPAAYELSRLLGLDNVPAVVLRRIEGKSGSLQIWVENAMTETTRKEKKIKAPDPLRWNRQMYVVWAFDKLIHNTDRNLGNVLIDPNWKAWMIDHTRAFRRHEKPENLENITQCERSLWEKLQALDEATLKERLKLYLRDAEIEAILKRRDILVEHIQKLIQEKGEAEVLYTLP